MLPVVAYACCFPKSQQFSMQTIKLCLKPIDKSIFISYNINVIYLRFLSMKTTHEVLEETGLTYPMLNRLKDLGIVPKPKLKGLGRRKGVVGVFEDDVIDIIKWVKKQQDDGVPLAQIAEHLRQVKVEEGKLTADKPNPSLVNWAARRFIELHACYPDDDFVSAEIDEPVEENPDGTVVVKFRIRRVPRKHK